LLRKLCPLALVGLTTLASAQQLSIRRVDLLPDRPTPYLLRDWRQTAVNFDRVVFDLNSKGPNLPLIWRIPNTPNLTVPGFGMPSYAGNEEMRGKPAEGIAAMGALLGATSVGLNKRFWVELTPQYFIPSEGTVLNNVNGKSGATFWYELLPSVVFTQLASRYPSWSRGQKISRQVADTWIRGMDTLGANFDHTSYSFADGKPVDNKLWKEPDAAAAVAYLELFQHLRTGDFKYLAATRKALKALQIRETNPTYEVLTAYGALAASYLNAEKSERWDTFRFVNWCFDPTSPNRTGWGMIAGRWGGYDVGGLMGSTNDGGGYAFAMNTFINAATLAPVARYDDRYSTTMAKWVLNLANASRLYYRDSLPANQQSSAHWKGDPRAGIAYEGLRRIWEGKSPYATGDAKRGGSAATDFGIYGGGYVGLLGALVHPTNVPMILRIDLRSTDFLPVKAYPTDLYWNPYDSTKIVRLSLGSKPVRLYDAVSNRFLSKVAVSGSYSLRLAPKQSAQIVQVPATGNVTVGPHKTLVRGIPIDYNNGRVPLPLPVERPSRDDSRLVSVPKASADGTVAWSTIEPLVLDGGEGSAMRAELRFAWNEHNLMFRFDQKAAATETIEAPNLAELQKHWWDFEDVTLCFDLGRDKFSVATIPELALGWSSQGLKNFGFSADIERFDSTTSGDAKSANRTIEGRIAWSELAKASGTRQPLADLIKPGAQIGCQPLLVDGTYKRQSYIGGARYTRPTGFDSNSRTLVLEGR